MTGVVLAAGAPVCGVVARDALVCRALSFEFSGELLIVGSLVACWFHRAKIPDGKTVLDSL